jgi:hypothetical protein
MGRLWLSIFLPLDLQDFSTKTFLPASVETILQIF